MTQVCLVFYTGYFKRTYQVNLVSEKQKQIYKKLYETELYYLMVAYFFWSFSFGVYSFGMWTTYCQSGREVDSAILTIYEHSV